MSVLRHPLREGSSRASGTRPRSGPKVTCSMTWGSASADRSIIVIRILPPASAQPSPSGPVCPSPRSLGGRQRRDGGLLSSEGDRHGRSHPVSAGNERCCFGFGRARCRAEVGNGKRATAAVMRYGCWRGKSSKGVNRVAGNANGDQSRLRAALVPGRRKRGEPLAGCGVQQTRDFYVEQAVMVVRNHEGGT